MSQKVVLNNDIIKEIDYTTSYEELIDKILQEFNLDKKLKNKLIIETEDHTVIDGEDSFIDCIVDENYPTIFVKVDIPKQSPTKNELDDKNNKENKKENQEPEPSKKEAPMFFDSKQLLDDIEKMITQKIVVDINKSIIQVSEENKKVEKELKEQKKIYIKCFNNISNSIKDKNVAPQSPQNSNISQLNESTNNEYIEKLNEKDKVIGILKTTLTSKEEEIKNLNLTIIENLKDLGSKIEKSQISSNNNNNISIISNNEETLNTLKNETNELKNKTKEIENKNSDLENEKKQLETKINELEKENNKNKLNFENEKKQLETKINELEKEININKLNFENVILEF